MRLVVGAGEVRRELDCRTDLSLDAARDRPPREPGALRGEDLDRHLEAGAKLALVDLLAHDDAANGLLSFGSCDVNLLGTASLNSHLSANPENERDLVFGDLSSVLDALVDFTNDAVIGLQSRFEVRVQGQDFGLALGVASRRALALDRTLPHVLDRRPVRPANEIVLLRAIVADVHEIHRLDVLPDFAKREPGTAYATFPERAERERTEVPALLRDTEGFELGGNLLNATLAAETEVVPADERVEVGLDHAGAMNVGALAHGVSDASWRRFFTTEMILQNQRINHSEAS